MDTIVLVLIIVGALIVGAAVAWMILRRRRSTYLRDRFGSEYDRTVEVAGSRQRAEHELEVRERRVTQLDIRSLTPDERERYAERWRVVQARFVDQPTTAVAEADELLTEVMRVRGYPVGDFEQRAADLSVHYPRFVENYRAAHELALRRERGHATTEDLRQAMVHYRALFEHLIESREVEPAAVVR